MKFIIVNVIYKGVLKLVLVFQTLQLITQRPIASIYEKPKKYLLIKVHEEWKPMATCVVDVHFVGCTQTSLKELAHVSKPNPRDPNKRQRDWKWTTSLCSSLTKVQLKTPTRKPSLWGWTGGYSISFLSPFTWCEQCLRAVISAEVWRMMEIHHLPQDCTFNGMGAETKLSKPQQIDVINVENVQDMIHVPSPWILKGKD